MIWVSLLISWLIRHLSTSKPILLGVSSLKANDYGFKIGVFYTTVFADGVSWYILVNGFKVSYDDSEKGLCGYTWGSTLRFYLLICCLSRLRSATGMKWWHGYGQAMQNSFGTYLFEQVDSCRLDGESSITYLWFLSI